MASNFLKQLQNTIETGKLQGVTNIKNLYEHFKDSGISYKDFKKQMHDYGIYGHIGRHDMARLSGMYYGSKEADFQEGRKAHMLARDDGSLVYKDSNLAITPTVPQAITPLNILVTAPIEKEKVTTTPKVITTKQNKPKKWYEGQDWSTDQVIVPANSGDPNNFGIVKNTSNSPEVFTGNRYYVPGVKTREFEEWIRNHPNYWRDQLERLQRLQTGGQVKSSSSKEDSVMQFVKALAQTLQADPQQVVQAAQQNPEALKSAVQVYQQTQDINQAAQAFTQAMQQQTQAAKHGAKLNYIKTLKNQCAEDEELYYFKRGGSVGCGCKKKEQGGELKEKKESVINKFKAIKKNQSGDKLKKLSDKALNDSISKYNKPYPKEYTSEDKIKQEEKLEKFEAEKERRKNIKKDCGGSKMKLKAGDKVKSAGAGCIAKFKMHKQGGSLNGIPFYQEGTNKGGIQSMAELIPIYGTYKAGQRFFRNPSWRTAGEFAVSGLADAAMLTGVGLGAGTALKAGNMAVKAGKVAKTASNLRKIKAARNLKYGQPYGISGYYDNAAETASNLALDALAYGTDYGKAVQQGSKLINQANWADGAANTYNTAKWMGESALTSGATGAIVRKTNK